MNEGMVMNYAVSINSSGQATIPKDVRDFLGIVPGENRLVFKVSKNQVVLGKEKTRAESLDAALKKLRAKSNDEARNNPAYAAARKKYAGKTFDEVRAIFDESPEGKKDLEEKYGIEF